ncbi:hypothetical protein POSPLADRAFT_1038484 [Postia placenta MAD-698-R-SB12]|uniref:Uncharacterized protein n=1 Tax=Postia placenta MAD-698-R-SB12 TaxID=670580 RepID=A0A1X6NCD0_9APHY|nr:hypothetical protein POSPLADRAFT_1038484 [Postia placenta MAD-698-R-SB12]OSX66043.1 hypothetical protein POSPLADRAFT_1038484 [Postia placenta MAD-698-R-SB12]
MFTFAAGFAHPWPAGSRSSYGEVTDEPCDYGLSTQQFITADFQEDIWDQMTHEIATSVALSALAMPRMGRHEQIIPNLESWNTHSWCRCHAPRCWFHPAPILPPRLAKQGACYGSSSRQCALQSTFAMAMPRPMRHRASEIRHSTTPLPPVVTPPPMQPILLYSEVVRGVKVTGLQSEKNACYSPSCKSAFPPPRKPKAARNSGKRTKQVQSSQCWWILKY